MNSMMEIICWLILVYSSGMHYNRLVSCEAHKNRSAQCDLTGDNCEKFSFERFQMNATKVNTSTTKRGDDIIGAVDTGALANLINNQENAFLQNIAAKMSLLVPAFDSSRSANTSKTCQQHTRQFFDALSRLEMWALQMHDATAKIPSGILSGNVNQYGDFDECLDVTAPNSQFNGKYCLAHIQITVPEHLPQLRRIRKLLQSHDAFVNDFNDPGHRVPRLSMINFGLCVPSTCSHTDVEQSLIEYVEEFTTQTSIQYKLRVDPGMCYTKTAKPLETNTRLAIGFFVFIVGIAVFSTLIEMLVNQPNELLVSFSLCKNSKALFSLNRSSGDISTIHGIRFINAALLLFSHKSMANFYNPHVNRTFMVESIGDYVSVIGRAAAVYTDAFIMLSGLLTAYTIIGRLQAKQSPRIIQEYISRFLRIVPMLGALILFCTFVLPELGSGPQWNIVIDRHAEICKENWWRNMLFVHNYFGFADMCLTHTHHLGIDTQLFVISPVLILILWKWPRSGLFGLLGIAAFSTVGRFYVTIAYQLSNYVYFGASIKQLFLTADLMYSIPLHRATIYIFGILLGYSMRMYPNVKFSKMQLVYGWSISTLLFVCSLYGPAKMGNLHYKYNAYDAAIYAALSPVAWCSIFAWIIYTTHIGYTTVISEILSCRLFLITTRIAYGVYLTQFPIYFYNVGTTRHAGFYNFIPTLGNLYEIICILVTSAVLTLFFDTPFQNIKQYTMRGRRAHSKPSQCTSEIRNGLKTE